MSLPKYYEYQKPILDFLGKNKKASLKEIRKAVRQELNLTMDDVQQLLPGRKVTIYSNRISWACLYLSIAGFIARVVRGTYAITEAGEKILNEDASAINNIVMANYRKNMAKGKSVTVVAEESKKEEMSETPDDVFERAYADINARLEGELLDEVMQLSDIAFEQMVLDLMAKMGYGQFKDSAKTTPQSHDGGIDGVIMEDKLGFNLIYVQAKHWGKDHSVGRKEVQSFAGAIAGKEGHGLFVTTSSFTREAKEYAERQHIILIDGEKLAKYMNEYNFGCSVRKSYEIKEIDSDIFDDYKDEEE